MSLQERILALLAVAAETLSTFELSELLSLHATVDEVKVMLWQLSGNEEVTHRGNGWSL